MSRKGEATTAAPRNGTTTGGLPSAGHLQGADQDQDHPADIIQAHTLQLRQVPIQGIFHLDTCHQDILLLGIRQHLIHLQECQVIHRQDILHIQAMRHHQPMVMGHLQPTVMSHHQHTAMVHHQVTRPNIMEIPRCATGRSIAAAKVRARPARSATLMGPSGGTPATRSVSRVTPAMEIQVCRSPGRSTAPHAAPTPRLAPTPGPASTPRPAVCHQKLIFISLF